METQTYASYWKKELSIDLLDRNALLVVKRLRRAGHQAFLVGGCVRDILLGRRPKDFDVATSARPNQVRRLFQRAITIGRRFKLVHVLFGDQRVEVATFRRLDTTDEADDESDLLIREDNTFGTPEEDARRRDFSVNGLFYDPESEEVLDYVGGLDDLRDRVLRTIGDPNIRFREDPVRIVRAIKFAARLGLTIDPATYEAMARHRAQLARSAAPRVAEEIARLLLGGSALESFRMLADTDVLGVILPEVAAAIGRAASVDVGDGEPDPTPTPTPDSESDSSSGRPPQTSSSDVDVGPEGLFWRQLAALDAFRGDRAGVTRAVGFTVLYGPIIRQGLRAWSTSPDADQGTRIASLMRPFVEQRRLTRRELDQIRLNILTAPRFEPERFTPNARRAMWERGYFSEAILFFAIDCMANRREAAVWRRWIEDDEKEKRSHKDTETRRSEENRREAKKQETGAIPGAEADAGPEPPREVPESAEPK
ncbi:MAG: polynucleotide adenylyltransferase PcnB [Deltaproteobacteria bacterium]|nr:polynucleotide adenylyltransferase PcnB [Deltaproteobacteria bacterium]